VTINFNAQNFSRGAIGDALDLALAAATNYVVNDTAAAPAMSPAIPPANWRGRALSCPVMVDDAAPAPLGGEFQFDVPAQALVFTFDDDVSATLSTAYLTLTNIDTGDPVPQGVMSLAYDAGTNTATITFPGLQDGALADGNYRATLIPAIPTCLETHRRRPWNLTSSRSPATRTTIATVNLQDFNILASHFGQSGQTFSTGDFNYDGNVNLADFNILASRFGQSVGPHGFSRTPITAKIQRQLDSLRDSLLA
jgi:hypothetical protein